MLEGEDLSEDVKGWIDEVIERVVDEYTEAEFQEEWDLDGLVKAMDALYERTSPVEELREDSPR